METETSYFEVSCTQQLPFVCFFLFSTLFRSSNITKQRFFASSLFQDKMNYLLLSLSNNNKNNTQLIRRSNISTIGINTINTINSFNNINNKNATLNEMNINSIVESILSVPVDVSRLSKQSFDLSATQKYCNLRRIKLGSNVNSSSNNNINKTGKNITTMIKDEETLARLNGIVNKINKNNNGSSNNNKNSSLKQRISEPQNEMACIHHLWKKSSWTRSLEEDCCYLEADCEKLSPNFTIIEPNSIDNIQSMAHMHHNGNKKLSLLFSLIACFANGDYFLFNFFFFFFCSPCQKRFLCSFFWCFFFLVIFLLLFQVSQQNKQINKQLISHLHKHDNKQQITQKSGYFYRIFIF